MIDWPDLQEVNLYVYICLQAHDYLALLTNLLAYIQTLYIDRMFDSNRIHPNVLSMIF